MNTGKVVTLIFIGAILLYVGVFGITALPFRFQLAGFEDYNSFTQVDPNNHITINSANLLTHVASRNELAYLRKQCSPFTDFTHSVEAMLTQGAGSGINWIWAVSPNTVWQGPDVGGANTVGIMIYNFGNEIRLYGAIQPGFSTWKGGMATNVWYRFGITKIGLTVTCTIYKETIPVTTLTYTLPTAYTFSHVFGCATSYYNTGASLQTMQIRNLQLSGVEPPPETGSLSVIGYADSTAVQFSAYYVGPSGQGTTVTVPTSGYTWSNLAPGTYTVYGTYNGIQKNQPVTVVAGQTVSATLTFAGTPPEEEFDFFKWIKDAFNDPMVKTVFTLGGVGCLGIGCIGLITRRKKPQYPTFF